MKCLILAAGYATRLYPLTENFPKPLLKVGEKTILDWLIDDIDTAGLVDQYVVISNHKFAPVFEQWAACRNEIPGQAGNDVGRHARPDRASVTVLDDGTSSNETRLGAVRDIRFAVETLGLDGELLVIAGDNLLDFSLTSFLRYAMEKQSSCTMRYYEADSKRLRKSGVSEVGEGDVLLSLEEKPENPKSNWCTPPFYFYKAEDVKRIKEAIADGCGTDAPGSLVAWMCGHAVLHSMEMPGHRFDIGNLESYETARNNYRGITK